LLLGSIMLIRTDTEWDIKRISLSIIIPAVATSALFFLMLVGMGLKAQRLRTTTGIEGMIGQRGIVLNALNPVGDVMVRGEIWNARSANGQLIPKDEQIRVLSLENLTVLVETLQT
jgi:membrane-bound serine protease (ClpP class)